MFILMFGYFVMGLLFLVVRFFYHILPKKSSRDNLTQAVKNDFVILYAYVKQIILSHSKIFKVILGLIAVNIILPLLPLHIDVTDVIKDAFCVLIFLLLVIVFAPQDNPANKEFPVEIFGFIYSIIFMFYCSGLLVFEISYIIHSYKDDMWFYGYIVTVISYIICIATLRRFMERDLSKEEIILLGMIILTTLEFITYYGIGFFGGLKWYKHNFIEDTSIFGDITAIINQGIFIASQSQILERSAMEVWGYIILNGTDVLTITVVLGYLVQKFMEM